MAEQTVHCFLCPGSFSPSQSPWFESQIMLLSLFFLSGLKCFVYYFSNANLTTLLPPLSPAVVIHYSVPSSSCCSSLLLIHPRLLLDVVLDCLTPAPCGTGTARNLFKRFAWRKKEHCTLTTRWSHRTPTTTAANTKTIHKLGRVETSFSFYISLILFFFFLPLSFITQNAKNPQQLIPTCFKPVHLQMKVANDICEVVWGPLYQ